MKLYLKLFLFTGGGFGLFRGIQSGLENGLSSGLTTGIIEGVFFGLVMSFFIGKWQKRKTRKMKLKPGEEIGPVQTKSISIGGSFEDVFQKSNRAIEAFKGKLYSSNIEDGLIQATTRISWKSFGENIEIRLKKKSEETVEVIITSKPMNPMTIVDYGKGRQNVTSFIEALES